MLINIDNDEYFDIILKIVNAYKNHASIIAAKIM